MDDALKRAGWIVILVFAGSYVTFVSADFVFNRTTASTTPIVARDIERDGEHHLTGVVLVPSTCDEINVATEQLGDNSFRLKFTTWEEPAVKCFQAPVERVFDVALFAATSDVAFSATLDKKEIPIAVYHSSEQ
jgi:hypothetical protein